MNIVARTARHRAAPLEAAAGLEQTDLVAVHIGLRRSFLFDPRVTASAKVNAGGTDNLLVPVGFAVAFSAADA
jgi:hypothetical protein